MKIIIFLFIFPLIATARTPVIYPNAKYHSVGTAGARQDYKLCLAHANEHLGSSGRRVASDAGAGAIGGAVVGATFSLLTGRDAGYGALVGGATNAVYAGTNSALRPDDIKESFINECLSEKGYKVIGWD